MGLSEVVICGERFVLDLFDIDDFARAMAAERAFLGSVDLNALLVDLSEDKLVELYRALLMYFDVVLGEGSLEKALKGKRNVMDGLEAFFALRDGLLENAVAREMEILRRSALPEKYRLENVRAGE